jgi:4-amino-4-deoxy-L-arabinose transferase-like glycosyltransferase
MSAPESTVACDGASGRASGPRRWHFLAVAGLTLFAMGVRLWGLDHLLPHRLEPDRQVAQQVLLLEQGLEAEADARVMTKYPWLLARLTTLGFRPPAIEADATPRTLAEHRRRASAVSLRVRMWVAFLGALAVPLTWWLARLLLSSGGALLATAIFATSLLHLDFSQQARAHVPAATFVLACVACAAHAAARGGRWSWLGACLRDRTLRCRGSSY